MSNYTPIVNFASKDTLISGNPLKGVKGTEITNELNAIATAVASKIDGTLVFAPDGSASQPSYGFTSNAGTGMFNTAGVLGFATGGVQRFSITAAGAAAFTSTLSTAGLLSANLGLTVAGAAFTSRGITDSATATALSIASTGAVTINAPTSGIPLTVNVTSAGAITQFSDGTRTGQIFGNATGIQFGSLNNVPVGFYVNNGSPSLLIDTTGAVNVPIVAASTTLAPIYSGMPRNVQNANYTFAASDINELVYHSAGSNFYDIGNATNTACPVGSLINVMSLGGSLQISCSATSNNLYWLNGGGSLVTGTRNIAIAGMITLYRVDATDWTISGIGIS